MCPVTFDALTNVTPVAALKTSYPILSFHSPYLTLALQWARGDNGMRGARDQEGHDRSHQWKVRAPHLPLQAHTQIDLFEREMKEGDIIPLKRGGTGFALTNDGLDGKLKRAVLELQ